jgi:hypothetical protein
VLSDFLTGTLYAFFFSPIHDTCPAHLIFDYLARSTYYGTHRHLVSPASYLDPNILFNTLFADVLYPTFTYAQNYRQNYIVILPRIQNVGICKHIAHVDFHEVSCRLVILLKVMYAIIEVFDVIVLTASFKVICFVLQIVPSCVLEMSASFTEYIVQIISCNRCSLTRFPRSKSL